MLGDEPLRRQPLQNNKRSFPLQGDGEALRCPRDGRQRFPLPSGGFPGKVIHNGPSGTAPPTRMSLENHWDKREVSSFTCGGGGFVLFLNLLIPLEHFPRIITTRTKQIRTHPRCDGEVQGLRAVSPSFRQPHVGRPSAALHWQPVLGRSIREQSGLFPFGGLVGIGCRSEKNLIRTPFKLNVRQGTAKGRRRVVQSRDCLRRPAWIPRRRSHSFSTAPSNEMPTKM